MLKLGNIDAKTIYRAALAANVAKCANSKIKGLRSRIIFLDRSNQPVIVT